MLSSLLADHNSPDVVGWSPFCFLIVSVGALHEVCAHRADGTSMWERLQAADRDSLVAEISDLVQRQLVTSTLQSERRDRLERNLRVRTDAKYVSSLTSHIRI